MYPTVGVGYITSSLRRAGWTVDVLSPLAHGVRGVLREPRSSALRRLIARLNQSAAHSCLPLVRRVRQAAAERRRRRFLAACAPIAVRVADALDRTRHDIVLISAYLMYYPVCEAIGVACRERAVPMIIGGAYLNQPQVAEEWRTLPGLTALVGGEPEMFVAALAAAAARGEPIESFPGVVLPDGRRGPDPAPLRDLDAVPFPDYSDFPWPRYPRPIVPMITGRGCGWGACTFCSDIASSSGRTFRSRSAPNVLDELEAQSRRHSAARFVFTDLKLNSNPEVWRALIADLPARVRDPRWIAAVHVDRKADSGLSATELRDARRAGLVRLTTGLESGSQRVLDSMHKGTDLARSSRFVREASAAGISVRVTMILGYPGEDASDVRATARFLRAHEADLDRVSLNRFQVMSGTRFHRAMHRPGRAPGLVPLTVNHRMAQIDHAYTPASSTAYRRAVSELMNTIHAINRRPLREAAGDFEGVM